MINGTDNENTCVNRHEGDIEWEAVSRQSGDFDDVLQDDSRSIETKGTEGNQQGSPQVEGQTGPNDGQEADGTKEIVAEGRYFHICPAELGTPETDKEDAKDNHKRTWQCQEQGTFEEVFLHRLDIALKGEDKRWKSFDKLVNQGNLNRNKWEGQ